MNPNRPEQWTYRIRLLGRLDVDELNPASPQQMTATPAGPRTSAFLIHCDQSGLIGLLRHLHGLGLTILSFTREPDGPREEE